jgi:hypothetical protein
MVHESQRIVTWSALLAKWTEFARAAVALPHQGESGMLKQSVPALIGLQAVTQALAELDRLARSERDLGLDRAAVLIKRYDAELSSVWAGHVPADVHELVEDARQSLEAAQPLR